MFVFPSSYIEALIPSIAVFGRKKKIKVNEVVRVGPRYNRISALIRRETRQLIHSLSAHIHGRRPCEDIGR